MSRSFEWDVCYYVTKTFQLVSDANQSRQSDVIIQQQTVIARENEQCLFLFSFQIVQSTRILPLLGSRKRKFDDTRVHLKQLLFVIRFRDVFTKCTLWQVTRFDAEKPPPQPPPPLRCLIYCSKKACNSISVIEAFSIDTFTRCMNYVIYWRENL